MKKILVLLALVQFSGLMAQSYKYQFKSNRAYEYRYTVTFEDRTTSEYSGKGPNIGKEDTGNKRPVKIDWERAERAGVTFASSGFWEGDIHVINFTIRDNQ